MDSREAATLMHNRSSSSTTSMFQPGSFLSVSGSFAFAKSSTTWNSVPLPCLLRTEMVPPIASTIYLLIDMPSPEPSVFCTRTLSSLLKESNIFFWYSSDIPIPVSFTTKWVRTQEISSGNASWYREIRTEPLSGVNFTAFPSRLISTWFSRTLSQHTSSARIS